LHLDGGLGVVDGLLEDGDASLAGAIFDQVHRRVEDRLGQRLLALEHHIADELGHRLRIVARIRRHDALDGRLAAAHSAPAFWGRLAPYLERERRRALTPAASSVPRRMW